MMKFNPRDVFGRVMTKSTVNLDALILREDFDALAVEQGDSPRLGQELRVPELETNGFLSPILRKPDFQRETSDWPPDRIAGLIESFIAEDLIPSVILWRSTKSGNIFTIDGAHRLSAFIAWINDDYGDGEISRPFFGGVIPEEQIKAAEQTRQLINSIVGSYHELREALLSPNEFEEKKVKVAKKLSIYAVPIQWVTGDATKAENSFFKINNNPTVIDPTELEMIVSRRKPNALATRALIRAGTGYKYWSSFPDATQEQIEQSARDIYEVLFEPALKKPIRTLDLPVANRGYSADSVKMVFELVNYVNNVRPMSRSVSSNTSRKKNPLSDDPDGQQTLEFLKRVRGVASRVSGVYPRSLGLHPLIYFYGSTGKFHASAFLAVIAFVTELEKQDVLFDFTTIRRRFEDFLWGHRSFINQIVHKYGGLERSLKPILTMYRLIFEDMKKDGSELDILKSFKKNNTLKFLKEITPEDRQYGRNFSKETKTAVYLEEAIKNELTCSICDGYLHFKSISFDHKERKEDGGQGKPENASMTHPYCNTGYKEKINHEQSKAMR